MLADKKIAVSAMQLASDGKYSRKEIAGRQVGGKAGRLADSW